MRYLLLVNYLTKIFLILNLLNITLNTKILIQKNPEQKSTKKASTFVENLMTQAHLVMDMLRDDDEELSSSIIYDYLDAIPQYFKDSMKYFEEDIKTDKPSTLIGTLKYVPHLLLYIFPNALFKVHPELKNALILNLLASSNGTIEEVESVFLPQLVKNITWEIIHVCRTKTMISTVLRSRFLYLKKGTQNRKSSQDGSTPTWA
ncbi:hypothetical protein MXB_1656, partial [Myxobolus squamalis]